MGITHLISKHNYSNFGGVNSYKRTIVFFFLQWWVQSPHLQTQLFQYQWGHSFFIKRQFFSQGGYSPPPFSNTTIPILMGQFFYKRINFSLGGCSHPPFQTQQFQYKWGLVSMKRAFGERGDPDCWRMLTHFDHRGLADPNGCLVMGVQGLGSTFPGPRVLMGPYKIGNRQVGSLYYS